MVADKYLIEHSLAEGAMGRVYVATQEPIGRKVALKILKPILANDDELQERFLREAVAVSKLHHPNTITVLDYGQAAGTLFIAMEFLDGQSLEELVKIGGPLPLERSAHILRQIASALTEAHDKNILHRDLKPPNIFISDMAGQQDFVKVLDFGIAKLLDNTSTPLTRAGMVFGTPEYMAPEQSGGGKLDGRTDIYALGVLMWQMLTGKLPYKGSHPLDTALKHTTEPIPALPDTVPMPMRDFVYKSMAKNINDRPENAQAFINELDAALAASNVPETLQSPRTAAPSPPAAHNPDPAPKTSARLWVVLGLVGVILMGMMMVGGLGAVVVGFLEDDEDPSATPPASAAAEAPKRTTLKIKTNPSKARVTIDGDDKGRAPVRIKGKAGSKITVTVSKDGFKTNKETVRFPKKGTEEITIKLKSKPKASPPTTAEENKDWTIVDDKDKDDDYDY